MKDEESAEPWIEVMMRAAKSRQNISLAADHLSWTTCSALHAVSRQGVRKHSLLQRSRGPRRNAQSGRKTNFFICAAS